MLSPSFADGPEVSPDIPVLPCSLAYLVSRYPMLSMIFILREVLQLREMGFQIDVASINSPDRPLDKLTSDEAAEAERAYYLKNHGAWGAFKAHWRTLLSDFSGYCRGLAYAAGLARLDLRRLAFNLMYFTEAVMVGVWMRRRGQRHLHVHLGSQAATVGLFVHKIYGYGFSMTVHGPDEFYDARGQYLEQKIQAADFICCISHYTRSQLMLLSPSGHWGKLFVSRLGVDPKVFAPKSGKPAAEVFEVLCVGRLTAAKGQHLLIAAIGRLAKQRKRIRLRLVGDGADGASLRKRAAALENPECVVFEGAANQDRIRLLYGGADLFCLASLAEGVPVVLMEAMAMEIPCVTTHITGIPELISSGRDGLLVPPSDVEALAGAIETLMDDTVLRDRLAKAGRARVLRDYDLRHNVEKLAAIFARRIAANSGHLQTREIPFQSRPAHRPVVAGPSASIAGDAPTADLTEDRPPFDTVGVRAQHE